MSDRISIRLLYIFTNLNDIKCNCQFDNFEFIFISMFCLLALAEAKRRSYPYPYPHEIRQPYQRPRPIERRHRHHRAESNADGLPFSSRLVCLRKPAIYLYPTKEMNLTVSVNLKQNQFTAVVPEFTAENYWNVTAKPNGELIYKNKVIPYLFWEALSGMKMNFKSGFYVKKGEARQFLEKTLTQIKLNDREKFDFMTYWLPTFNKLGDVFCSFQLDNYCHSAPLGISVKPDSLIRVFLAIRKAQPGDNLKPVQQLPNAVRKGFTIVEWGGAVVNGRSRRVSRLQ